MGKNDFYSCASGQTEIDLRTELNRTIYGNCPPEIAKGQPGLIRKFRRDDNDKRVLCSCVNPVTGESPRELICPVCLGEKYLWDEEEVEFYLTTVESDTQLADREMLRQPAVFNTPFFVIYIPSSFTLTQEDKIVRLVLDKSGTPVLPQRRRDVIRIASLQDMRLDNGRLEFWKASGYLDNLKNQ